MATTQLMQQEFYDKNVGSISKAAFAVGRKSKPHIYSYTSTRSSNDYKKIPNVDIVARKVAMRGNVGPKRTTRS